MLKLDGVDAFYGDLQALFSVSLEVPDGKIMALVGANAAGKSTTIRVISGLLSPRRGRVLFGGEDLARVPAYRRVELGIVQVPEGRRLFPFMTVTENLLLGAHTPHARGARDATLSYVHTLFPVLHDRRAQLAGSLSGGEQQMCAIGRALMARPKLLMLDEPSMGLAPIFVEKVFETIVEINKQGTPILLVEQNALMALDVASRGYVLETGKVALADDAKALRDNERVRKTYLGEE